MPCAKTSWVQLRGAKRGCAVSDSKVNRVSHLRVWNGISIFTILSGTVAKLCVFSLELGQGPRHSVAHPHPKLSGVPPGISSLPYMGYTGMCRFQFESQPVSHFSVWNGVTIFTILSGTVAKLCVFSLELGQGPRHSVAHPHPKLSGVPPRDFVTPIYGLYGDVPFPIRKSARLTFFSLERGNYFHHFVWNGSKIVCL